ncbi:MAG: DNA-binding response regulator [Firmicutes bacterium HGW-Firmicutes-3]|jgi:DNA-binding response OmpR family regulator|nr:MAG: DNA-binding response regulator [Firmicutes bacterium HGW-Firmicutes-3]
MKHIFTVDDDKEIRLLIKKYLEKEDFKVTDFSDPMLVLSEIDRLSPDLIILDIMMPGIDGIELCKKIRKSYDIPIIFISARGEEIDRIIGLEVGADDYLPKPFSPRELLARIKNIFRRLDNNPTDGHHNRELLVVKNITLSVINRYVKVDDIDLNLTVKEFDILCLFMENPLMAFSRNHILEKVWGYEYDGEGRLVDDVIKRLRKKLATASSEMDIITVWGYGYKIE